MPWREASGGCNCPEVNRRTADRSYAVRLDLYQSAMLALAVVQTVVALIVVLG